MIFQGIRIVRFGSLFFENMKVSSLLSAAALLAASSFLFFSCSKSEHALSSDRGKVKPSGLQEQRPYTQDEIDKAIYIPGSMIVKLTPEAADAMEKGSALLSSVSESLGVKHAERLFPDAGEYEPLHRKCGLHQYYIVDFDSALPLAKAQEILGSLDGVETSEKRNIICRSASTNDPGYAYLWEYSGRYSINVEDAWKYTTGDPSVVVCVVDGGLNLKHEDLAWNCGSVNWNFVRNSSNITPEDHGCHVAGTIAGVRNNGKGLAGIAGGDYAAGKKGVTLMSAQVFQGNSTASSFQNAIVWGADNGAVISQNSWGNDYDFDGNGVLSAYEKDYALRDRISSSMAAAIDYFIAYAGCDKDGNQKPDSPMKGGLVVFAAGNDGIANGVPASYAPVIAVGASGMTGRLSSFSNYGSWVDICAPGESIYSCVASGSYDRYQGTSMACPHVSGALALLLSQFGGEGFTNENLKEVLLEGANASLINYNGKAMGPYLDVMGSMRYGLSKYGRENNNPPVIETSYTGDFKFRQWESVSIPFTVSDPDGDNVEVTTDFEGRAKLVRGSKDPDVYNFEILCELVSDFTPKKAKITATDVYGGTAEYEFAYQVIENRPPVVSEPINDVVLSGDGKMSAYLDGVFSDPDDEPLEYSAKISPDGVADVSISGDGKLVVAKKQNGLAVITVTAKDRLGAKVSTDFKIVARDESYTVDYYPNPVRDFLNVRPGSTAVVDVMVKIASTSGSVILEKKVSCNVFDPARIDMSAFAPGEYKLGLTVGADKYDYVIVKR